MKLIKMGGRLVRHARRLVFQLAEVAVPKEVFQGVLERIGRLCAVPGWQLCLMSEGMRSDRGGEVRAWKSLTGLQTW